jgi:hypothetical protein
VLSRVVSSRLGSSPLIISSPLPSLLLLSFSPSLLLLLVSSRLISRLVLSCSSCLLSSCSPSAPFSHSPSSRPIFSFSPSLIVLRLHNGTCRSCPPEFASITLPSCTCRSLFQGGVRLWSGMSVYTIMLQEHETRGVSYGAPLGMGSID